MLIEVGVERYECAERRRLAFVGSRQGEKSIAEEFVGHDEVVKGENGCGFESRSKEGQRKREVEVRSTILFLKELFLLFFS